MRKVIPQYLLILFTLLSVSISCMKQNESFILNETFDINTRGWVQEDTEFHKLEIKDGFYYIKSIGDYGSPGFIDPIINFSPIRCGIPIDNVPPCPPILTVSTDCDEVKNYLSWTNPNHTCDNDIAKYYIYFSQDESVNLTIIDSILSPADTIYVHENQITVTGCYAVTAIDSTGNESIVDKSWQELSPELNKKLILLAGVLKEMSDNPATKEAIKEAAKTTAVNAVEIMKVIQPDINKDQIQTITYPLIILSNFILFIDKSSSTALEYQ